MKAGVSGVASGRPGFACGPGPRGSTSGGAASGARSGAADRGGEAARLVDRGVRELLVGRRLVEVAEVLRGRVRVGVGAGLVGDAGCGEVQRGEADDPVGRTVADELEAVVALAADTAAARARSRGHHRSRRAGRPWQLPARGKLECRPQSNDVGFDLPTLPARTSVYDHSGELRSPRMADWTSGRRLRVAMYTRTASANCRLAGRPRAKPLSCS
jgi:hypothetical protein